MPDLSDIIGQENAQKLADYYGGECIYIPKTISREKRNQEISETFTLLLQKGSTCMNAYEKLSSDFCISPRRIMQIVNK